MSPRRTIAGKGPLRGRRILVVEDEYFLAEDIANALKASGANVLGPVGELDEAIGLVKCDGEIDAALLDVNLHDEMVFPLARMLQARTVPFVFASGYDRTWIEREFREAPLWEKPLDLAAMPLGLAGLLTTA